MARIPAGRELMQITVDKETADLLRVKAALRRMTVGNLVDELTRQAYSRDQIVEEWAAGLPAGWTPPEEEFRVREAPPAPRSLPRRAAKAPEVRAGQEPQEELEGLWQRLDAHQKAHGLSDQDLANAFQIKKENISQWRRKGAVPSSRANQAREILAQA